MTMDKSLRRRSALVRNRSVLSRAERIERLRASDRWQESDSPLHLPKVRVYKLTVKKKKKKKEEEEEQPGAGEEGTEEAATPSS